MTKISTGCLLLALLVVLLGTPGQSHAQTGALQASTCTSLVVNSDMQSDSGWTLNSGPIAAQYSPDGRSSSEGDRGLRIGPSNDPARKGQRWSSALQRVTLPETGPLTLSFWYRYTPGPKAAKDGIEAALLDTKGDVLTYFFKDTSYQNVWREFSADITQYAGREAQIFFAVQSDGATGKTSLAIDDVTLCDPTVAAVQPAPVAEPTPIATTPVAAITEPAVAASNIPAATADLVSFSQLGVADQTLRRPYDAASLSFGLPADWQVGEGAKIQLNLATFQSTGSGSVGTDRLNADTLDVSLNGVALSAVPLATIGTITINIPIPAAALTAQPATGLHQLVFTLRSGPNCNVDQQTGVIVRATSSLDLPHTIAAPATDLASLPRPIYQQSFIPSAATIVVPDQPTSSELEAALTVAAGFGRMTDGKLDLDLVPVAKLTAEQRQANNLIFVGKPAAFALLNTASLAAPIDGSTFKAADATASDGIVQMVVSPWNAANVLLVIGGSDDAAVVKAGKALSTGVLRGGSQPNVAVVADARPAAIPNDVAIDRSFAELGYGATSANGSGDHTLAFRFAMPANQAVGNDAYIDLVMSHSTLLAYERSSIMFSLNGEIIRGVRLSDNTAALNTLRLNIPASLVRSGSNELIVHSQFVPQIACSTSAANDLWMTIWPESTLHMPTTPAGSTASRFDLASYPQPFRSNSSLNTTAFVLSADPVAWDVAAQIAFGLGRHTAAQVIDLNAAYADAIPEAMRQERNLLVIGQPQALPVISELNDALPLPFEAGTNTATARNEAVTYRTPQATASGYVQILAAPWNPEQAVLAVLGSNDDALRQAGMALMASGTSQPLQGNVAVIRDNQIMTTSQASTSSSLLPVALATQDSQVTPVLARPAWVTPAIAGAAVLVLAIIAFIVLNARRQRRSSHSNNRLRR